MTLILYYDDRSPPVRSCLLLIKILKLNVELKFLDLFKGEQMSPDFLEINPSHTAPTLIHNDLVLTDSHSIMMYLCDVFGKDSGLFPENPIERIKVVNQLFFESSILFRRDSDFMSDIVRKGFANIDLPFHQRKILEAYSIMEKFLTKTKFMAGENMTIADISMVTSLSSVDIMFPVAAGIEDKWPRLNKWFDLMRSLPEFTEANAIGLEKLRLIVEKIGKFTFPTSKKNNSDE